MPWCVIPSVCRQIALASRTPVDLVLANSRPTRHCAVASRTQQFPLGKTRVTLDVTIRTNWLLLDSTVSTAFISSVGRPVAFACYCACHTLLFLNGLFVASFPNANSFTQSSASITHRDSIQWTRIAWRSIVAVWQSFLLGLRNLLRTKRLWNEGLFLDQIAGPFSAAECRGNIVRFERRDIWRKLIQKSTTYLLRRAKVKMPLQSFSAKCQFELCFIPSLLLRMWTVFLIAKLNSQHRTMLQCDFERTTTLTPQGETK